LTTTARLADDFVPKKAATNLLVKGETTAVGGTLGAGKAADEGIYVIQSARGTYVGQSGNIPSRMSQHLVDNGGRFTQAELNAAERIVVPGGKTAREIAEQQRIDAAGGIDELLNVRNPIGKRRLDLMPQPYSRP